MYRLKVMRMNPGRSSERERMNPKAAGTNGSVVSSFGECPQSCTGATFPQIIRAEREQKKGTGQNGTKKTK